MLSKCSFLKIIATFVVAWSLGRCPVFGAALKTLSGHVPAVTSRLAATGRVPATNQLHLAIGVPLRDAAGLDQFLGQVSDPASPNFRNYLTPEMFTARFGPTEQDYAAVQNFARTNGLTIVATHGNRLLLDVAGPAAAVEKAFHIKLRTYRHPTENRDFFAPDTEPTVNAAVPVLDVSGLNDFARLHPNLRMQDTASRSLTPQAGSGSGGTYLGDDFRNAYVPGTPLTGAGEMVGLVQFDGFYASDIATYATLAGGGRTNIVIQTVLLDGFSGTPTTGANSGNIEVSLDIEMAMSMAPGLAKIVVFEAPNNLAYFNDVLNAMATNYLVKNLSTSWGGGSPNATSENIFKQLAAQGQSFFNATGDSDAFVGAVSFPSESVNITQVGGTTLTTGTGADYNSETVWNRGNGVGSSGGISTTYSIPSWQQGISMAANSGSTTMRNIPDVALTADNVEDYYGNGTSGSVGGTSCAAPLWAGFLALVNQQAAAAGRAPVGFANPSLYAIARGPNYASCFHDTTMGNNFSSSSPSLFAATTGYDLCTGWGTPAGTNLINALFGLADTWGIFPAGGLVSSGNPGGPFTVTSQIYTLTNSGAAAFSWQLSNTPTWLTVSPTNGVLAAGGQMPVTVSLNSAVASLAAGSYHADLIFSNQTTSVLQLRPVDLQVLNPNIVQNGGFETGSFTSWTLVGNGVSGQTIYNVVVSAGSLSGGASFVHSGTYGVFMGDNTPATLTQTLTTTPGQSYLLSFWLANPVSGAGQEFLVNWNGNQIYFLNNPPVLAWTNLTFVVKVTGASTTLQFGAANPPDGFGLDDISVIPLASPTITLQPTNLTVLAGNSATFSARASGAAPFGYQWLKNGNIIANGTGITGATTNVLTLAGVTTTNAGNYSLVITNVYGSSTSSVAALIVDLPVFNIQSVAANHNGGFTLNLTGTPGASYVLEATTNLLSPAGWLPVATNMPGTNGLWQFTEPQAANFQKKFYRLEFIQ